MRKETPPLVLIEIGCEAEGLVDPVVTKDVRITNVQLDWRTPTPVEIRDEAIRVLAEHEGDHPRIDEALRRLRAEAAR